VTSVASNIYTVSAQAVKIGGCLTHAREINPSEAMKSGERPRTEVTSAMVSAVALRELTMVTIRAAAPTIRIRQKTVRKIQPELFIAPCFEEV
jgi:hypothetical protein